MKKIILTAIIGIALCNAQAQQLSRKVFLGISMDPVTDSVVRVMKLKKASGVLIKNTIPGSTAEASGLKKGDVIVKLGDTVIDSIPQVYAMLKGKHIGETLPYSIIRENKLIAGKMTTKGMLQETYAGLDVTYGEVQSGNTILRTIVTRQKEGGKKPAILFVQGVGCYSMDSPMDSNRNEIQLLSHLVRRGYVVMRVDKSGVGDSKGIPCDQLDFNTELEGYKQAYVAMKNMPDVDTAHCFIIGHSMGGVMAPLIAKENPVKGIIAYGTIGVNFMEYWANTRKTLADAYEMDDSTKDEYVKLQCQCVSFLVESRMKEEEALKINPACQEMYDALLVRDYAFWYQLMDINIPAMWQHYPGKVLTLWGSSDFISAKIEHQSIAAVVNKAHKGNATFKEISNASHGMGIAATFADGMDKPSGFNTDIETAITDWLRVQLN